MKCVMILAAALALAPLVATAQLYKHVDKNGRTVYSDQPPTDVDSKQINISTGVTNAPAGAKSYVAQDKENQKKRKEADEKAAKLAAKGGDPAKKAQEAEARCAQAKSAHQYFVDGGRIFKNNEKGEREFMSDAEIDSERARTRREMDAACQGR